MLYVFSVKVNWEIHQPTTDLYVLNLHITRNDTQQNNVANDAEQAPERWQYEGLYSLENIAFLLMLQLYFRLLQDNLVLKEKLQEMELLLNQNKVELERLRQV